jgi:hypothetical protein
VGDHTPDCDGSMNRGHPTPTPEEVAQAVARLARFREPHRQRDDAVPASSLRALLASWEHWRDQFRATHDQTPPARRIERAKWAAVHTTYHNLIDELRALVPEGEAD